MRRNGIIVASICAALCAGIITYGWFNNWIIITYNPCHDTQEASTPIETETICVTYVPAYHTTYCQEARKIISPHEETQRAERILQQWLSVLDESHTLDRPCYVQSVTTSPTGNILYVSFDRPPFNTHDPAYTKWHIIETALACLRENGISADNIHFLVHHQPISDYHLNFTHPWPITGFHQRCEEIQHPTAPEASHKREITLVLDPAGNNQFAGRDIGGCFERGLTLQCCQQLQQRIQSLMPHVRVLLTRHAGEHREPLQNAAFINRVNADLCISIHMYYAQHSAPHSYIYYYLHHPQTDFWHPGDTTLKLQPYHHAHTRWVTHNYHLAHALAHHLEATVGSHMAVGPVVGMPFTPLCGIQIPAVAFEVGLRTEDAWQAYIHQWTTSICNTIMHITKAI